MSLRQIGGKARLARLNPRAASRLLALLFLLDFFAGCAPRALLPARRPPEGIFHLVKSGENLFRIGKAYDVPYQELARLNGIADPHRIRSGQKIFVPGAQRQLPVEIITPAEVTLERPKTARGPAGEGESFIWPVNGTISSKFGPRGETFHDGVDISVPEGTPIRSMEKGEVLYSDQLRGYGNLLIIRHSGGFVSVYAHNRKNLVQPGAPVTRGQIIAEAGTTGRVTGPHLHLEIRKDNVAQNPLYYLPEL